MTSYIEHAAIVQGWSAYAFARLLRRYWRDEVEDLPPHLRRPLEESLEALRAAGAAWERSLRGSAEAPAAEAAVSSDHELSTRQAAEVLQVSDRRIRQLLESGALTGRRCGQRWWVDHGSLTAYKACRKE